jgi:hypothetical protein
MSEDDSDFYITDDDDSSVDESSTARDSLARSDSRGEKLDIEAARQEQVDIGGQDSVGVSRWRAMVILMLSLTAALVISTTYIFLSHEETDEFEKSVRCVFEYYVICIVELYLELSSDKSSWRDKKDQKYSKRR